MRERGRQRMELYWMIVTNVFMEIETIVLGYVLYRFARPFMENKKGAFCIAAAYFITMPALYAMPVSMNNFVVYGIGVLVAFLVMCRIDPRNLRQKVYIVTTFFSLRWLSLYMTRNLTIELYNMALNNAYMMQHPAIQLGVYIGSEILDIIISFAIIGLSVRYIVKAYIYKQENMSTKEMLMLTVPSVTGMVGYGIMQYYNSQYEITVLESATGVYRGLAMLYYAVSILSIVVMAVMFQNIKARQAEELQNRLLATQVDSIRHHIGQVESLYRDIRGIRHDMANHILTLERLYEIHATEEAKAYATDLKAALAEAAGDIKSGNPVTDVILQERKDEAEKKGIRFQSNFHYPPGTKINAFDISVILSNALQNAAEHAGDAEKPYISIVSYCRKNAYMIEVGNSFAGELRWDAESGLPLTSKEKAGGYGDGQAHGYGLANIRRVARKYYGDIDIAQKEGEFFLSILLMVE